jgi:uncharacterized protein YndB with AHSA1/START domain
MSNVVEPVRKQLVVEAPVERAFRVFTENAELWWPAEHHIGKAPMKSLVLEPRVGGRWYEIGEDGSQCEWGKVLVWEPPRRLVLAWQLTATWQFDASFVTEVEVKFTAEGARRTHVDFEHRNLERFGEAARKVRESIGADSGWPAILGRFAARAATEDAAASA